MVMIATPTSSVAWTRGGTRLFERCSSMDPLLLRRLAQGHSDERVEPRVRAEFVLSGGNGSGCFRRLEAEVGEGGERIRRGSGARGRAPGRTCQTGRSELACELVGNPGGELRSDAIGTGDHRLVAGRHRARQLIRTKDGQDGKR